MRKSSLNTEHGSPTPHPGLPAVQPGPTWLSLSQHLTMPPAAAASLFRPVLERIGETPATINHEALVLAMPELEAQVGETLPPGISGLVVMALKAYVRSVH